MTESELRRIIDTYADGVRSGIIPSCQFIRLAIDRWFDDCQREDLVFDIAPAILFVNFAEQLKHFKGDLAGQPIRLEPWQIFAAANILCWLKRDTGLRRYQYADILVPRKNGKTTFAAILALFLLFLDGEAGAEVYTAAVDKAQAKICFEAAKILIEDSIFEKVMTIRRGEVRYDRNHSHLAPLSKDTKNKDGLNPYCAVCDERHAWPTNEIYDVLNTGMGARSQPLIISISTAGMDTSLPYYSDIQIYKDVMLGHKQLDNHFIMIYTPDDGDRWDDPVTWAKVNPNLGVSLLPEYIQQSADEARMKGGTTLASFLVKNLNLWVDAPEVWIPDDQFMANNAPFDEELLKGKECYVGIDLASKGDITATALYFPSFNVFKMIFVIPEEKVRELEDRVDYRRWMEQGWVIVTPGAVLDEDWYVAYLLNALQDYKVRCIAYDPWGTWNLVGKLKRYEQELLEYQQSIRYMSVPTKHLEGLIRMGKLNFLGNPVMRWMVGNVTIYTDPNANVKLDKSRSRNKIDGVAAAVDAIGGYLTKTSNQKQLYSDHTLRTVRL